MTSELVVEREMRQPWGRPPALDLVPEVWRQAWQEVVGPHLRRSIKDLGPTFVRRVNVKQDTLGFVSSFDDEQLDVAGVAGENDLAIGDGFAVSTFDLIPGWARVSERSVR